MLNYLLLEDGSYFLLETGDKLLLEDSTEGGVVVVMHLIYLTTAVQENVVVVENC